MSSENPTVLQLLESLPLAPEGWLEDALMKLNLVARDLTRQKTADDVMREAVSIGLNVFGFKRIGAWFFEDDRKSMVGSFGIEENGEFSDERHLRIFDRSGSIAPMVKAWDEPPHICARVKHPLRTGAARIVGKGIQVISPLIHDGDYCGFLSVDDLLGRSAINQKTGYLLNQYASIISAIYFEKKAEEERLSMEELAKQAEQVKVDFLGMISHEIRTPLNAIMGYSQLLCAESDSENTSSLARTIEENGDHLMDLINGMLDYAQLSGADSPAYFSACDPVSITGSTVDTFSQVSGDKRVEITYSHKGDFEGYVLADPVSYRQIITNLIQNALKFTPSGGEVSVHLQTRRKLNRKVEFFVEIEDSGIGISQDNLLEIFKPFKQIDSSRTRKAGGVGMGLAIVDRLVKGLGGVIDCRSELGKGTVFSVDFVFEMVAEEELPPALRMLETEKSGTRPKCDLRILIAEDNEENRKVLQSMLTHLGYPYAVYAKDGIEAKNELRTSPYDLVLMDAEMPKLDGLSLTLDIRAGRCGPVNQEVSIIGVSAVNMKHDRDQCLITGMTDYITKPIKMPQLKASLDAILAERKIC